MIKYVDFVGNLAKVNSDTAKKTLEILVAKNKADGEMFNTVAEALEQLHELITRADNRITALEREVVALKQTRYN